MAAQEMIVFLSVVLIAIMILWVLISIIANPGRNRNQRLSESKSDNINIAYSLSFGYEKDQPINENIFGQPVDIIGPLLDDIALTDRQQAIYAEWMDKQQAARHQAEPVAAEPVHNTDIVPVRLDGGRVVGYYNLSERAIVDVVEIEDTRQRFDPYAIEVEDVN